MKKYLFILMIFGVATGCSAIKPVSVQQKTRPSPETAMAEGTSSLPAKQEGHQPPWPTTSTEEVVPLGTIFAKTVFEGVVKTTYVQLSIADLADPVKTYELYVGDIARQQNFPWKMQTVKPGYFFVDLPPGQYRIKAITIPVGTTLATELMDITFAVTEGKVAYLGTLKVVGVNEKIKLGGVPIIRPGFEYSVYVVDERAEAAVERRGRFPEDPREVVFDLMKVHAVSNIGKTSTP